MVLDPSRTLLKSGSIRSCTPSLTSQKPNEVSSEHTGASFCLCPVDIVESCVLDNALTFESFRQPVCGFLPVWHKPEPLSDWLLTLGKHLH